MQQIIQLQDIINLYTVESHKLKLSQIRIFQELECINFLLVSILMFAHNSLENIVAFGQNTSKIRRFKIWIIWTTYYFIKISDRCC